MSLFWGHLQSHWSQYNFGDCGVKLLYINKTFPGTVHLKTSAHYEKVHSWALFSDSLSQVHQLSLCQNFMFEEEANLEFFQQLSSNMMVLYGKIYIFFVFTRKWQDIVNTQQIALAVLHYLRICKISAAWGFYSLLFIAVYFMPTFIYNFIWMSFRSFCNLPYSFTTLAAGQITYLISYVAWLLEGE